MKNLLLLLPLLLLPSLAWAQPDAKAYRVYLGTGKDIYQLELDLKDGSMTKPTLAAEVKNPSFVAIHPNKKFLYSVSEVNKGSIVAFAIDRQDRQSDAISTRNPPAAAVRAISSSIATARRCWPPTTAPAVAPPSRSRPTAPWRAGFRRISTRARASIPATSKARTPTHSISIRPTNSPSAAISASTR